MPPRSKRKAFLSDSDGEHEEEPQIDVSTTEHPKVSAIASTAIGPSDSIIESKKRRESRGSVNKLHERLVEFQVSSSIITFSVTLLFCK